MAKEYYLNTEKYDWVDVADHFKGIESFFHRNRRKVMLGLIRKYSRNSVLVDAGCGTGLILQHLPDNTVGLDINPRNLKLARKYCPESHLVQCDLENLPLKENIVTTIICTETLEHLPSPEKALEEFSFCLKNKAFFIGSVPHKSIFWKFRFLSSTCPHSEPFHNEYELETIQNMLNSFTIILIKYSLLKMNIVFVVVNMENKK